MKLTFNDFGFDRSSKEASWSISLLCQMLNNDLILLFDLPFLNHWSYHLSILCQNHCRPTMLCAINYFRNSHQEFLKKKFQFIRRDFCFKFPLKKFKTEKSSQGRQNYVQMENVGTSTFSAVLEILAMFVNFSEYCVITGRRYKAQKNAKRTKKIKVFTTWPIYPLNFSISNK